MDDSALYTGVDGEQTGQFGNESVDENVQQKLDEQRKLLAELTPQLEGIVNMIEAERKDVVEALADLIDKSSSSDDVDRAEIKAAARYRKYLDVLMTKFRLALQETKK